MTPYDCVSAWDDGGLIHVVPDSKTLAKIQADPRWGGGGAGALNVGAFSSRPLREYLRAKNAEPSKFKAACDQFTRSLAGYCVATLIMGIGDRRECENEETNKQMAPFSVLSLIGAAPFPPPSPAFCRPTLTFASCEC